MKKVVALADSAVIASQSGSSAEWRIAARQGRVHIVELIRRDPIILSDRIALQIVQ